MSKSPIKKTIPRRRLKADSKVIDIGTIFSTEEKFFDDPEANAEALRLVYVIYENFIFSWYQHVSNDTHNSLLTALTADGSLLARDIFSRADFADRQTLCQALQLLTDHFQLMNVAGLCESPKWAERYLCTSDVEIDRIELLSKALLQSLCLRYSVSTLTRSFLNDALYTAIYRTIDTLSEPLVLYELLNKLHWKITERKVDPNQRLTVSQWFSLFKVMWYTHTDNFSMGLIPFHFFSQLMGLPIQQPFLYGLLLQLYRIILQTKVMDRIFAIITKKVVKLLRTIDWKEAILVFRQSFFPNRRFYLPPREVTDSVDAYKSITASNIGYLLEQNYFIDYVLQGRMTAERMVESLSDKRVNRVILIDLMELLVVTLFPECAAEQ